MRDSTTRHHPLRSLTGAPVIIENSNLFFSPQPFTLTSKQNLSLSKKNQQSPLVILSLEPSWIRTSSQNPKSQKLHSRFQVKDQTSFPEPGKKPDFRAQNGRGGSRRKSGFRRETLATNVGSGGETEETEKKTVKGEERLRIEGCKSTPSQRLRKTEIIIIIIIIKTSGNILTKSKKEKEKKIEVKKTNIRRNNNNLKTNKK